MRHRHSREVATSRHCSRLKSFVCVSILFSAPAFSRCVTAQTNPPVDDDEVLRVNTDLILFPARIRDQRGERPNGLTEHDLFVKDPDGVTTKLYLAAGVDRVAMVLCWINPAVCAT